MIAGMWSDASKIRREPGWHHLVTFEDGIERTERWDVDHESWMKKVISGEYVDINEIFFHNRIPKSLILPISCYHCTAGKIDPSNPDLSWYRSPGESS